MYKILTLVIIIHLFWNLYCPPGSVEFQVIMELRRLQTIWRLHPPWKCGIQGNHGTQTITHHIALAPPRKCGIPGNRGSLPFTPHALAPPLEVWNSWKSWKSGGYTPCACTPPGSKEFQVIVEVPPHKTTHITNV